MRRLLLASALVLAACGDYSNDDLDYLDALPTKQDLQVTTPGQSQAAAAASSADAGPANLYVQTVATAQSIDSSLELLIDAISQIRTLPPTQRMANARLWGPFPDSAAGYEDRVTIVRQGTEFSFELQQRAKGQGEFVTIISGTFVGVRASVGHGTLRFDGNQELLYGRQPEGAFRTIAFQYQNDVVPRRINTTLGLPGDNSPANTLSYQYEDLPSGAGDLLYDLMLPNVPSLGTLTYHIKSQWLPGGAGRADGYFTASNFPGFRDAAKQCWDTNFGETYYNSRSLYAFTDGGLEVDIGPGLDCSADGGTYDDKRPCPRGDAGACVIAPPGN